ncbi:hypothetical protein [Aquabacterium sp. OR-4]|uniref:hypothetical protein n=1 Tax=Aquabacterium sp. OR-4 TaxID=2978127 RepID=UPI0021B2514E|nr:hypothetical protein [Aquabacterium sp. OR-4]MDT7834944.1 hypothetical protein [Aquabacterium sp. OR-4]
MSASQQGFMGLCKAAVAACLALALGGAQATVQFDPTALGLGGSAFETSTLTGGEVSRIDFGAPDAQGNSLWQEHGFLIVDTAQQAGGMLTPTGLGSDYTLYIQFDLLGVQPAAAAGYTTQATVSMYAVPGVSSFGFDSQGIAVATHAATPILVASMSGAQVFTYSYPDPAFGGAPTLGAQLGGVLAPVAGNSFLSSAVQVSGVFYHPFAGLGFINGGASVLIQGGHDTLSLSAVPEPATPALWLGAALLLGLGRRRWRAPLAAAGRASA